MNDTALILRFVERLAVIVAALYIAKQGVKMLVTSVEGKTEITWEGVAGKLKMTNVATGAVLVLFSIITLSVTLSNKLEYKSSTSSEVTINEEDRQRLVDIKKSLAVLSDSNKISQKERDSLLQKTSENVKQLESRTSAAVSQKQQRSEEFKYADQGTGAYTGGKIQMSTIKALHKKLQQLKEDPSKIDRSELSELIDIYQAIYELNLDQKELGKEYSYKNLKP